MHEIEWGFINLLHHLHTKWFSLVFHKTLISKFGCVQYDRLKMPVFWTILEIPMWFLRKSSPKDSNQIYVEQRETWFEETDGAWGSATEAGRWRTCAPTTPVPMSRWHSRFHSRLGSWEVLLILWYLDRQPRQLSQAVVLEIQSEALNHMDTYKLNINKIM